jgi:radical SAM-linked protein
VRTLQPIRIRFKKQGRARFISHLDLNRCMARAIRRANIPVWYTQGFNPHPYITFALPLSIFYGGQCEIMDARIDGEMPLEEVKQRLAAQMPEGIEILDVCEPVMKAADCAFARYEITFEFEGIAADKLNAMLHGLLVQADITIEKTTKHGTREVDLKPYFIKESAHFRVEDGIISFEAVLPASNQENLNPSCFTAALLKYAEVVPDLEQITRTEIYNAEMQPFK